jgi:hypothetical protein
MGEGLGVGFEGIMHKVRRDMEAAIPTSFSTDAMINAQIGYGASAEGQPYGLGSAGGGTIINQSIQISTPKALSERELSREFSKLSRQLALEIS